MLTPLRPWPISRRNAQLERRSRAGQASRRRALESWEQSASRKTDGVAVARAAREGANFPFDVRVRYAAGFDHARFRLRLPWLLPRRLLLSSRLRLLLEP